MVSHDMTIGIVLAEVLGCGIKHTRALVCLGCGGCNGGGCDHGIRGLWPQLNVGARGQR